MDDTVIKAILKINPNAEVSVSGNDINTIVWENGTTPIPVADIQAQIPTVEAEIEQEKQDAITKKASGKQKVTRFRIGSDAEIKALIGI
jgi:hypothetical protein